MSPRLTQGRCVEFIEHNSERQEAKEAEQYFAKRSSDEV